jgi:hypothetical protein
MIDYRAQFAQLVGDRLGEPGVPDSERRLWTSELEVVGRRDPEDDIVSDLRFLERWPIEMRLGVLRIMRELGEMDRLRRVRPAVHDLLLAKLKE